MPKVRVKKRRMQDEGNQEEEEVFSVEKVLNKRIGPGGRIEYLLKWMNYPESESTWEPRNNLDCPELIQAYENEHSKKAFEGGRGEEKVDALMSSLMGASPSSFKKRSGIVQSSSNKVRWVEVVGMSQVFIWV